MQFLSVSAALFVAAGAFPALAPPDTNSTLAKPDANSASSILEISSGGPKAPAKRDNFLDAITPAIDDLENSVLSLGSLVNNHNGATKREADNSVTSTAQQATDDDQGTVQSSANLANTKRDNMLSVVTRAIDNIENTIIALGQLTNSASSKREADNSVTSTAQQATDDDQGTVQSSANLVNTKAKRDNILDGVNRAIDDLENSTLALGSLFNGNNSKTKRMDNTASAIIQVAIDDIQSAIGSLAGLTTSD